MEVYHGRSLGKGIAIGKLFFYQKQERAVHVQEPTNLERELFRYREAKKQAKAELEKLCEKARADMGEESAAVLEAQMMLLEDESFDSSVFRLLCSGTICAEDAVSAAGEEFFSQFSAMEDDYFRERAVDVRDVADRLVAALEGRSCGNFPEAEPVIVAAEELVPSETVQMDKSKLLAFVTERGSENSHTAILARTMNLPAISGIQVRPEWNGRLAAVDGKKGILYLDPSPEVLEALKEQQLEAKKRVRQLHQFRGRKTISKSGKEIRLYANVGSVSDVKTALENDAEGIGLFRSEFLYLEKGDFPTEEELFCAYKTAASMMDGKEVIIRTLDIGADKQAGYFGLEQEENPAMGCRAIRLCLLRPELFRTQLRAIYRASVFGNLSVMYPMIISVEELSRIRVITEEVKESLRSEKLPYKEIRQGIMIETPAAALISDLLAKEVDFFSIGTNDLGQYAMAIDRQNPTLEAFYDSHHPALLRMIRMTVENGHAAGCLVGICGELAADTSLTGQFLEMGVDELSVAPGTVLKVRKAVVEHE